MNNAPLVLTKDAAVKRHVLGLKQMSRDGVSKLLVGEISIGERLIPSDAKVVAQLVFSIRQIRQTTPILVRLTSDGIYALIDGFNRIEALKQLGETEVLATVVDVTSDEEAKACEAISNSHRRPKLTALDRALTDFVTLQYVGSKVSQLATPCGGRQPKEKYHAKTARELGVSPDQIARSCKIAKIVPYVQNAIRKRKLEDNQSALLEIAASGDDVHSQIHTLGRVLNRRKPEAETSDDDTSETEQLSDKKQPSSQSRSSSSTDRASSGFENAGTNGQPSGGSSDNMSGVITEGGDVESFAQPAAHTRGQPVEASETDGKRQGGVDRPDAKDRYEERGDAEVGRLIQLDIPPALRARLASMADSTAIRIIGLFHASAGAQPSIEVQDVTELGSSKGEDESD